jgi:hypothetical protein
MQWLIGTHLVLAILNGSTQLLPAAHSAPAADWKLLLTSTGRSELAAGIDLRSVSCSRCGTFGWTSRTLEQ